MTLEPPDDAEVSRQAQGIQDSSLHDRWLNERLKDPEFRAAFDHEQRKIAASMKDIVAERDRALCLLSVLVGWADDGSAHVVGDPELRRAIQDAYDLVERTGFQNAECPPG